jgi:diguanylate cyclase (GGDEF)-like protein
MAKSFSSNSQVETAPLERDIDASLRALDRRDWWHFVHVVVVMFLLMGTIFAFWLPNFFEEGASTYILPPISLPQGLLALVLIFNVYILYQHHGIQKLRECFIGQVRIAAEQKARADSLYELAILDPLTGLYNRRFGEEYLQREIFRAGRSGAPLMLVVFDLNDFKNVNDSHGHVAGDAVLKEFALRLKKATRRSDVAVRLGGDEFLVVLPECPPDRVGSILSRLNDFDLEIDGKSVHVSACRGWAQLKSDDTRESLIQRADQDLYSQKSTAVL